MLIIVFFFIQLKEIPVYKSSTILFGQVAVIYNTAGNVILVSFCVISTEIIMIIVAFRPFCCSLLFSDKLVNSYMCFVNIFMRTAINFNYSTLS